MSYVSECIADFYVKRNIIREDEKLVYQYGISLIINDIFTFLLIILISTLFWKFIYSVEFLITLCVTRVYCGGFHAKKAYVCKISMIFTFLCVMLMSTVLRGIGISGLILILSSCFLLMLPFIPVRHPNKKVSEEQMRRNKLLGIIMYLFFAVCACFVWMNVNEQDGAIITLSLCAVTVLVMIGTFINCKEVSV